MHSTCTHSMRNTVSCYTQTTHTCQSWSSGEYWNEQQQHTGEHSPTCSCLVPNLAVCFFCWLNTHDGTIIPAQTCPDHCSRRCRDKGPNWMLKLLSVVELTSIHSPPSFGADFGCHDAVSHLLFFLLLVITSLWLIAVCGTTSNGYTVHVHVTMLRQPLTVLIH